MIIAIIVVMIKLNYLFTCLIKNQNASYKLNTSKEINKTHTQKTDDTRHNNSNIIIIINLFIYLFMCLLNSPKANYIASTSKETNKRKPKHKQRQNKETYVI
jgi:heptaprenylglyceryl phosphate synthase